MATVPAMRAVVCTRFDEPEALELQHLDSPPCGRGQVRVHVWASGVDYVDALFVQGRYQIRPAVPFVPGSELAGEITEVGSDVDGFSVGDRVMASIGLGGFADEVVLAPEQLVAIPTRLTYGQAATMTQSYADGMVLTHPSLHRGARRVGGRARCSRRGGARDDRCGARARREGGRRGLERREAAAVHRNAARTASSTTASNR